MPTALLFLFLTTFFFFLGDLETVSVAREATASYLPLILGWIALALRIVTVFFWTVFRSIEVDIVVVVGSLRAVLKAGTGTVEPDAAFGVFSYLTAPG